MAKNMVAFPGEHSAGIHSIIFPFDELVMDRVFSNVQPAVRHMTSLILFENIGGSLSPARFTWRLLRV